MTRLNEQIQAYVTGSRESARISAKGLLYLKNRAAVDQALSRLAELGQLIRAGRGVYLRPVASRFGTRVPSVEQAVEARRPLIHAPARDVPHSSARQNAL